MKKKKSKAPVSSSISRKVIAGLRKTSTKKVVDLSEIRNARIHAENLEETIITEKETSELDPLHAVYVYAKNKMSVMAEQISELPSLSKLVNAYANAQDLYMPSGPPTSPLTHSYFILWGFLDLCVGIKKETFGTIIIDVCKELKVEQNLITVFEYMQNSRMGFYVHNGFSDKFTNLRELITDKEIKVVVPAGYIGQPGEIILARIMPEPFPELGLGYSVLMTTPYIILEMQDDRLISANEKKWLSYFERSQEKTKIKDKVESYEILMKYGLNRHYWNEYIFEGYVNHKKELIMLAGFPDIASSRPHSDENSDRF
ncbi:hypothetical protein DSCO28_55900 [Desulfosarcina ovata subsp. sediminis]|uniref:Uncharacterized protein n=1 Tax=Desulfosarcina ovata subsp. sediminis TaxID=885957 RepID=A0A5K7ZXZ5_9BACT|nr:hypothetical protein [Desulfosarcina ovata]BBO85024.1 hypothetical protein DSCO28_55900 [Desulfosarcina ovata subsp. sediminis]